MASFKDLIPNSAVASLLDEIRLMEPDFSSSLYPPRDDELILNGDLAPEFVGQLMAKIAEFRKKRKLAEGVADRAYARAITALEALLNVELLALAPEYIETHKVRVRTDGRIFIFK